MDWQKNRLMIGAVALIGMIALTFFALRKPDAPSPLTAAELPEISRDAITAVTIQKPDGETVTLQKKGDAWRVTAPIDAEPDHSNVTNLLDKLATLEVRSVAATKASNHEKLDVTNEKAIKVEIKGGDKVLAKLYVGAYKGKGTMVRAEGDDRVYSVKGSIQYVFNKGLKDWRDKKIVDVTANHVTQATFTTKDGVYNFARVDGDFKRAEGEEEIERFDGKKVHSVLSSLARMRALDFAKDGDDTGLDAPVATVSFVLQETEEKTEKAEDGSDKTVKVNKGEPQTIELLLGKARGPQDFYLQRKGNPIRYVVAKAIADRINVTPKSFQAPDPAAAPPPSPGGMPGMPGGMGGMPGGGMPGGGQIPPELMKQIQQQMQQQGGH